MGESLGKAVLELEADLTTFDKNMQAGEKRADSMEHSLEALAAAADVATEQLQHIRMKADQAAETSGVSDKMKRSLAEISAEAERARADIERVKIGAAQATESTASGDIIDRKLKDITGNANEARRSLESVRLASIGASGAGGGSFDPVTGRFRGDGGRFVAGGAGGTAGGGFAGLGGSGAGGGGGIGLLGAAIGGGTLLAPAAGPAVLGLLGAIPVLAASGAGALGTLALAFDGVFKAIGGDKKAFDDLGKSAQGFVQTVRSLDGWFDKLKQSAAGSLFPGLTQGLKSALSPGTLNAITQAVTEFGHAIGDAGAAWGRYFGSAEFRSIFGPLMATGAHNLSLMSDAALHLFDAIGVLARAAIPFTDWMVKGIDAGSRWFDAFMHAKDATGALGSAMNQAETSLRLVGNLAVALGRAVFSLGEALYPVSKIAVKDLTEGLNFLAGLFQRNRDAIREVVGTALTGLVTALKIAVDAVKLLNDGMAHFIGSKASIVTAILAIGAVLAATLGPEAAVITGVLLALGLIKKHWDQIAAYIRIGADHLALGIVEPFSHLPGVLGEWARRAKDAIEQNLSDSRSALAAIGSANGNAYGQAFASAAAQASASNPLTPTQGTLSQTFAQWKLMNPKGTKKQYNLEQSIAAGAPSHFYSQTDVRKLLIANGVPPDVATNLAIISAHGEDPSGDPTALNNNAKTGDYSLGLFQENFLGKMGVGRVKQYAPQFGLSPTTPVKDFVSWLGKHPSAQAQIAYQIYQSQGYGAWTTAAGLGISGGGSSAASPFGSDPAWTKNLPKKPAQPTGAALLPESLRNALQKAKDKATTTQGATAAVWLHTELDDLDKARKNLEQQLKSATGKKKAAIENELRSIDGQISSVNRQITTNLHAQAQAIKTAFASQISTAKSNISAAMSTLKATLDSQLQAHLQTYIDTVLGPKFFQGTDAHGIALQTPAEAKYAAEQAADTLKSLQDAIDQATDPAARDAAQRQLDEYNDSIAATKERAQADYDYAQAVKTATAAEQEDERQLNLQLDLFSKGLANGTTNIADLAGIVGVFGLSLVDEGGIVDDFAALGSAVQDLAAILIRESQALGGVGDDKDAAAAAARAAALNIPKGAPVKIPGTNIDFAGFVAASLARNLFPSLDVGGHVDQTGLAVVHRGEDWSGVGANRRDGAGVTLAVGPVYGALDTATARRWAATLKTELDRVIQL